MAQAERHLDRAGTSAASGPIAGQTRWAQYSRPSLRDLNRVKRCRIQFEFWSVSWQTWVGRALGLLLLLSAETAALHCSCMPSSMHSGIRLGPIESARQATHCLSHRQVQVQDTVCRHVSSTSTVALAARHNAAHVAYSILQLRGPCRCKQLECCRAWVPEKLHETLASTPRQKLVRPPGLPAYRSWPLGPSASPQLDLSELQKS